MNDVLTTSSPARRAPEPMLEVRQYAPAPGVVLMRVSGVLDSVTAPALAAQAGLQLGRAPHLVIDLAEVGFLAIRGLDTLRTLREQAIAAGTHVYLTAPHYAVRRSLLVSGLDRLFPTGTFPELAVAGLTVPTPSAFRPASPADTRSTTHDRASILPG